MRIKGIYAEFKIQRRTQELGWCTTPSTLQTNRLGGQWLRWNYLGGCVILPKGKFVSVNPETPNTAKTLKIRRGRDADATQLKMRSG
jgi:hypothetical protein